MRMMEMFDMQGTLGPGCGSGQEAGHTHTHQRR